QPRRHDQDGRPPGQRPAAPARGRGRRHDGLRFPGPDIAVERHSGRHHCTSFQKDLQGLMTHDHVKGLDDLKDKTILVATPGRSSWWPWLRRKFSYSDAQTQPYTFNLQPFFNDKNVVQQSYPSSEPFQALQKGVPVKFFLFADNGYPPYGTTMVTTTKLVAERPDVARRFVRASIEGWKSYLKGDPAPANALIKADNPKMSDEQIAF